MEKMPDLSVEIGGLRLKNPVIAASGTFGYGEELLDFYDPSLLGAVIVKGLSLKPMPGNPPPRTAETPCGMLNSIGLANIGIDDFIREKLASLNKSGTTVIANIFGYTPDEYGALARKIEPMQGIAALEVNISCPNVEKGGMAFGTDPDAAAALTEKVVNNTSRPVIVKLTPNVTDIVAIARAVESAGACAVSVANTFLGMAVDVSTRRPKLGNIVGGLSGPAVRPMALYLAYSIVQALDIPVIGSGGIMDYKDALEYLIVGAKAVQVGTANFVNPRAAVEVAEGLKEFCINENMQDIKQITNTLEKRGDLP